MLVIHRVSTVGSNWIGSKAKFTTGNLHLAQDSGFVIAIYLFVYTVNGNFRNRVIRGAYHI